MKDFIDKYRGVLTSAAVTCATLSILCWFYLLLVLCSGERAYAAETAAVSIGENDTLAEEMTVRDLDAELLASTLELDSAASEAIAKVPEGLRDDALAAVIASDDLYRSDWNDNKLKVRLPYAMRTVIVNDSCNADLPTYDCEISRCELMRASKLEFPTMREAKAAYDELLATYGPEQVMLDGHMEPTGDFSTQSVDLGYGVGYVDMHVLEDDGLAAYAESQTDKRPKVAIFDTGIMQTHVLFQDVVFSADSRSDGPDMANSKPYHGTHIAGTLTQGVPTGTEIVDMRISDLGTASNILEAVVYADQCGCDVGNMSYILSANASTVTYWDNTLAGLNNMILVCAAGNDKVELTDNIVPACCSNAITVTSARRNYGEPVDFSTEEYVMTADIISDGDLSLSSGTSNASPQVAAFAADLRMFVDKDDIYDVMKAMCTDLNEPGWDATSGWGRPCFDADILEQYRSRNMIDAPGAPASSPTSPTMPADPADPGYDPTVVVDGNAKAAQEITFANGNTFAKAFGDKAFGLGASASGAGRLSYKSSDKSVARASSAGKVRITGTGSATITVTAAETDTHKMATATASVTVSQGLQGMSVSPASKRAKTVTLTTASASKSVSAVKVKNAETQVRFSKAKVSPAKRSKYFKVGAKTGRLTVAKDCPAGKYRVKIRATAKASSLWRAKTSTTTVTVRVA